MLHEPGELANAWQNLGPRFSACRKTAVSNEGRKQIRIQIVSNYVELFLCHFEPFLILVIFKSWKSLKSGGLWQLSGRKFPLSEDKEHSLIRELITCKLLTKRLDKDIHNGVWTERHWKTFG